MKKLLYSLLFLIVFGAFFYFFSMNSEQTLSVKFWGDVKTPELPAGLVVIVSFLLGFMAGALLLPLTYVIKRLSS